MQHPGEKTEPTACILTTSKPVAIKLELSGLKSTLQREPNLPSVLLLRRIGYYHYNNEFDAIAKNNMFISLKKIVR